MNESQLNASSPVRLVVVSAGLSAPSSTRILADLLAAGAVTALEAAGAPAEVHVVELRPLAHELTDMLLTGFAAPALDEALQRVATADALIVSTPVFSASYSGLFKMFFDVLAPETLAGTPVVIGATAGTSRHALVLEHALRPLFAYLKAIPVPTAVFGASEDLTATGDSALARRAERAGRELAGFLGAGSLKERPSAERREPSLEERFEAPTPFAEVLARVGQ